MKIVRTIPQLRQALDERRREPSSGNAANAGNAANPHNPTNTDIGLVPTMGALHEGHLSLLQRARTENQTVVLSIFVNPTQFNEAKDLDAYPRQETQDAELAASVGVDLIFAPSADEMYPEGFSSSVRVSGPITETLEAAGRGSAHFEGVATVVAKLLLAVGPQRAYFGQKDAQQLRVVQRMVADLNMPTHIVGCETSRDADGLARSSRNVHLSAEDRQRALQIPRALAAVAGAVAAGQTEIAALRGIAERVLGEGGIDPEYLAFVDPDTFAPVTMVRETVLCAIAARVRDVRLIDNELLSLKES